MPTEKALKLDDCVMRCAVLRRLGLPVIADGCECAACGRPSDSRGFHRTTCMRTGLVHARHRLLIQTWRRVFREAKSPIPDRNVERLMGATHIRRSLDDRRRMDLIASGIPGVFGGQPLFMDATCVSPVHGTGEPMPRAADNDGAAVDAADRKNREVDYPDVEASSVAQLLCLGVETYGRWSRHSVRLVRELARARAANAPETLRRAAEHGFASRWWALLSTAVQQAVGLAVVRDAGGDLHETADATAPVSLVDVLDLSR